MKDNNYLISAHGAIEPNLNYFTPSRGQKIVFFTETGRELSTLIEATFLQNSSLINSKCIWKGKYKGTTGKCKYYLSDQLPKNCYQRPLNMISDSDRNLFFRCEHLYDCDFCELIKKYFDKNNLPISIWDEDRVKKTSARPLDLQLSFNPLIEGDNKIAKFGVYNLPNPYLQDYITNPKSYNINSLSKIHGDITIEVINKCFEGTIPLSRKLMILLKQKMKIKYNFTPIKIYRNKKLEESVFKDYALIANRKIFKDRNMKYEESPIYIEPHNKQGFPRVILNLSTLLESLPSNSTYFISTCRSFVGQEYNINKIITPLYMINYFEDSNKFIDYNLSGNRILFRNQHFFKKGEGEYRYYLLKKQLNPQNQIYMVNEINELSRKSEINLEEGIYSIISKPRKINLYVNDSNKINSFGLIGMKNNIKYDYIKVLFNYLRFYGENIEIRDPIILSNLNLSTVSSIDPNLTRYLNGLKYNQLEKIYRRLSILLNYIQLNEKTPYYNSKKTFNDINTLINQIEYMFFKLINLAVEFNKNTKLVNSNYTLSQLGFDENLDTILEECGYFRLPSTKNFDYLLTINMYNLPKEILNEVKKIFKHHYFNLSKDINKWIKNTRYLNTFDIEFIKKYPFIRREPYKLINYIGENLQNKYIYLWKKSKLQKYKISEYDLDNNLINDIFIYDRILYTSSNAAKPIKGWITNINNSEDPLTYNIITKDGMKLNNIKKDQVINKTYKYKLSTSFSNQKKDLTQISFLYEEEYSNGKFRIGTKLVLFDKDLINKKKNYLHLEEDQLFEKYSFIGTVLSNNRLNITKSSKHYKLKKVIDISHIFKNFINGLKTSGFLRCPYNLGKRDNIYLVPYQMGTWFIYKYEPYKIVNYKIKNNYGRLQHLFKLMRIYNKNISNIWIDLTDQMFFFKNELKITSDYKVIRKSQLMSAKRIKERFNNRLD